MDLTYYKKFIYSWILVFIIIPAFAYGENLTEKAENTLRENVFNFEEVEPGFYRSGCPLPESYSDLKAIGIKTVINFIDRRGQAQKEAEALEKIGIETVLITWNGFDYPKKEDVKKFIEIVSDPSKRPVLVHCKRGAERTGIMIALWRVAKKGWSADQAFEEMKEHRFRDFWYGHLKKYLYTFAKEYGQKDEYSNNILERFKTNTLYGLYRLRKPLFWYLYE